MKSKFNIVLGFVVLMVVIAVQESSAQQDPLYTQYTFNTQVINPAYAGTWDNLGFTVLGRHQWVGMGGAPKTYSLMMQTPTKFKNAAIGLNVISDKIGLEKRLALFGDYSYKLYLSEEVFMNMGLKFGVTSYSNNLSEYTGYPGDPQDPMFQGEIDVRLMPNFGVGTFIYGEKFYVGLSVPKILQNEIKNNYNNYDSSPEIRHLFFMGGYVFDLSEDIKFKPTMLTKATIGAPVSVDLSANFLLKEKFWLGAQVRTGDSFGLTAQWIFDNQLRVGYGIDFTYTKLQHYHNGTHEIMVSYELEKVKNMLKSPRLF